MARSDLQAAAAARAKGAGPSPAGGGGGAAGEMNDLMNRAWELIRMNFNEAFPVFGSGVKAILTRVQKQGAEGTGPAEASATPQGAPQPTGGTPAVAPPTPERQAA